MQCPRVSREMRATGDRAWWLRVMTADRGGLGAQVKAGYVERGETERMVTHKATIFSSSIQPLLPQCSPLAPTPPSNLDHAFDDPYTESASSGFGPAVQLPLFN